MSEERTQPASKRRRLLARQHGQVAHSPELTSAAGWVAALAALALLGSSLVARLAALVRGSLMRPAPGAVDLTAVVALVRSEVLDVAWPLSAVVVSFAIGALFVHQCQVRGLWATRLIVPDPSRLWSFSRHHGLGFQIERTLWTVVKAIVLVTAAVWSTAGSWSSLSRLSELEVAALGSAAAHAVLRAAWALAGALVVLGLLDYGLRHRRFEAMLRTTPQEQREDQRVMEGDPAARAQRFRVARLWRGDAPDLLVGASLILTGTAGLTLVLAGGPPPRRVDVRSVVKGAAGLRVRRAAKTNKLPMIDAPEVARRLARRPAAGSPATAEVIVELASIWPVM
jgi:flagellar biosynthesis protein FlhB